MTTDTEEVRPEYARTNPKHWINITAEDIPPGWIDDMVKRMFEELNRQLIRLERASGQVSDKKDTNGNYPDTPEAREQHSQTYARVQAQIERLTRLETERAALRAIRKKNRKPSETRADIQRKLLIELGRRSKSKSSGGAQ